MIEPFQTLIDLAAEAVRRFPEVVDEDEATFEFEIHPPQSRLVKR